MASKFNIPKIDFSGLKSFDWRSLKKLASPNAADDLNKFLEKMPANVGQTMLVIAAVAWSSAGMLGLYTTVQLQQLTELRAELEEASALQPVVPEITERPINARNVKAFVERTQGIYRGIDIKASGSGVVLTAKSTGNFGQWREAIGHVQNGGSGWRVNIDKLCVGRECSRDPLAASLKINTVKVDTPAF